MTCYICGLVNEKCLQHMNLRPHLVNEIDKLNFDELLNARGKSKAARRVESDVR